MGTISNDFVTIEFKTKRQEKTAMKYMEVFNLNKVLYKGILNGKTTIHSNELECLSEEQINTLPECLMLVVAKNILDNEKANKLSFSPPKPHSILHNIFSTLLAKIEKADIPEIWFKYAYYELAYYYCIKENDFKYLHKYIFDENIDINDTYELCNSIMLNHYNELVEEEILYEENNYCDQFKMSKNYDEIISILPHMFKYLDKGVQEIYNAINSLGLDESSKSKYTYKLTKRNTEKLIRGALKYIDPSGNLLTEYINEKEEGRIKDDSDNILSAITLDNHFYVNDEEDYGINLYPKGNIRDVIDFMHEYGHLHEFLLDKKLYKKNILSEFISIYFELKTVEFLVNCGCEKEVMNLVESFRIDSNLKYALILYPLLINNNDKEINGTSYFENLYPEHIKSYALNTIYDFTNESDREAMFNIYTSTSNIIDGIEYLFGSFLADYAVNNLKSEEVLSIINNNLNEKNIYDVLRLFSINIEELNSKESKIKIKHLKDKTK